MALKEHRPISPPEDADARKSEQLLGDGPGRDPADGFAGARGAAAAEPVGPLTLKGYAQPVPAFRLIALRAAGTGANT